WQYIGRMNQLSEKVCVPCRGGEARLTTEQIDRYLLQVDNWELIEVKDVQRIRRRFRFPDFGAALAFTWEVGRIAEEQDHHPRMVTQWGSVTVDWWTHAISGLHENDFVMAAKTDDLYERRT
ncbi:MAG: 4a-hydroxytetrahydrobiopterin dehydratase, partial [Alkalispirochaeta sp.]